MSIRLLLRNKKSGNDCQKCDSLGYRDAGRPGSGFYGKMYLLMELPQSITQPVAGTEDTPGQLNPEFL